VATRSAYEYLGVPNNRSDDTASNQGRFSDI